MYTLYIHVMLTHLKPLVHIGYSDYGKKRFFEMFKHVHMYRSLRISVSGCL